MLHTWCSTHNGLFWNSTYSQSMIAYTILNWGSLGIWWKIALQKYTVKALAHYNWSCKKISYRPYTLQLFFTTVTIFSTVLYMDKDFYKDFFRKIFVKIFVVCEGLYMPLYKWDISLCDIMSCDVLLLGNEQRRWKFIWCYSISEWR